MYRATCESESEQQAAWRIFVVGIILNDARVCSGLLDLGIANISFNGALKGMAAEPEFTSSELSANVNQCFHGMGSATIAEALFQYNEKRRRVRGKGVDGYEPFGPVARKRIVEQVFK